MGWTELEKLRLMPEMCGKEVGMTKRRMVVFSCIGFLFSFFQITERKLAAEGNIQWTGSYTGVLLLECLLAGLLTGAAAIMVTKVLQKGKISEKLCPEGRKEWPGAGKWLWLGSFLLLLLCWLPFYLAYYPGIMAYDITIQTGQVVSHAYTDHHPILHTLLITAAFRIGEALFGSVNTGMAILVFVQQMLLASAMATGVLCLWKRGINRGICVAVQLLCMFYPLNGYLSVSLTKDVFFSAFFVLQLLCLCQLVMERSKTYGRPDVLFFASGIAMQLFRNNGRYAFLCMTVVLLPVAFFARKDSFFWRRLAGNCVLCLLVGSLLLTALFRVTGAEQGDKREMLSMPIQQLARCMLYHGGVGVMPEDDNTICDEDKALIHDFLLDDGYLEYRPDISDPVKRHTNTYVVRYRTGDFARTYFRLLRQHPGDFINAGLAVNAGFFYVLDESHAHINENGRDRGLGYIQTRWVEEELGARGIYKDSKLESLHRILEDWADQNGYLKIPVLKYIFMPGIFLWLYLFAAGFLLVRKQYGRCVPFLLVAGYYLTMFLGPTVQLRYLYPVMILWPFLTGMVLSKDNGEKKDECKH